MLIPAILMKKEIEREFQRKSYTADIFFYNGWIGNLPNEVKQEEDLYAFAIVDKGIDLDHCELIGYISFRIDFYSRQAYNFGLIRFMDEGYFSRRLGRTVKPQAIMAAGILEVIRMLEDMNLHRIEFRCVEGNPAECGYKKIIERFTNEYRIMVFDLEDVNRDQWGQYHDSIIFQLIRKYDVRR